MCFPMFPFIDFHQFYQTNFLIHLIYEILVLCRRLFTGLYLCWLCHFILFYRIQKQKKNKIQIVQISHSLFNIICNHLDCCPLRSSKQSSYFSMSSSVIFLFSSFTYGPPTEKDRNRWLKIWKPCVHGMRRLKLPLYPFRYVRGMTIHLHQHRHKPLLGKFQS